MSDILNSVAASLPRVRALIEQARKAGKTDDEIRAWLDQAITNVSRKVADGTLYDDEGDA